MLPGYFLYIGILIQIVGGGSYIIDTLKGKTKPNRVTWFLWALAPLIAFAAMMSKGVGPEALATLIIGILPIAVLISSFISKSAQWKIEKFDIFCGAISVIGLVLWLITDEPNIAIFFSIVADGAAAAPTIKKVYFHPETESGSAFIAGSFNALLALLTIRIWNFENYGFQLYWLIVSTIIFVLSLRKLRQARKAN